jgi:hypothetical protein
MYSAHCKEAIAILVMYLKLTPLRLPDRDPSRFETLDTTSPTPAATLPCIKVTVSTLNIYRNANFV